MTFTSILAPLLLAGFPPSATPEAGTFQAHALGATSLLFRSEPVETSLVPDGFSLQQIRLAIDGGLTDWLSLVTVIASDLKSFGPSAVFLDARPASWIDLRVGRWILDTGPTSGLRIEDMRFADSPLMTEKFLGPGGMLDTGLGIAFIGPFKTFPVSLTATITSGNEGPSFGPDVKDFDGLKLFKRLLYMVRIQMDPGKLFGQTLTAGFLFGGGANPTGPGNRTDLIGADASALFDLGKARVFADVEFTMRRYSSVDLVKNIGKLDVEGGLTADAGVILGTFEGALRFDLLGVPTPPDLESGRWRLTAAAGWRPFGATRFLAQYSARDDDPKAGLVHEVTLQAICALDTSFGSGAAPAPRVPIDEPDRPSHKRHGHRVHHRDQPIVERPAMVPPLPAEVMPTSSNPADWLAAAKDDLATARALLSEDRQAGAAFAAQQAAVKALRAAALRANATVPLGDRSATGAAQALSAAGAAPTPAVVSAARELDRHHATARFPSDLGGAPSRFYDREAATRAVTLAADVLAWTEIALGAAPVPPVTPPTP